MDSEREMCLCGSWNVGHFFLFFFSILFIYLAAPGFSLAARALLVVACGNLVPRPGIKPRPLH